MSAAARTILRVVLLAAVLFPACAGRTLAAESREAKVERKLRGIVIPKLEFRQADIREVIEFLVQTSRELDPAKAGVNIVLNLGAGVEKAAARKDRFAQAGVTNRVSDGPLITFSARHLSLEEALKIVTQSAGLKYRVQGNVVMVVPVSAPDGPIVHRFYDVLPTFPDKIGQLQEPGAAGE